MGYIFMGGAIGGFWIGGFFADRFGNARLFNIANISKCLIMVLFALVQFLPLPPLVSAGLLTFFFGLTISALGIGTTSEAMRSVDNDDKSFGIALSMTLAAAGASLASIITSQYLKYATDLKLSLGEFTLNHYEIFIFSIALGLGLMSLIFRFKTEGNPR